MVDNNFIGSHGIVESTLYNVAVFVDCINSLKINGTVRKVHEIYHARVSERLDVSVTDGQRVAFYEFKPITRSAARKSFKHAARVIRLLLPVGAENLPVDS